VEHLGFYFFSQKMHAWQVLHLVLQPHLREAPPGGGSVAGGGKPRGVPDYTTEDLPGQMNSF